MIRIIGSEMNLRHRALEVYVSGCIRDCPGCHNPEAQAFGNGMRWDKWLTANRYKLATGTFRNVWILGGRPPVPAGACGSGGVPALPAPHHA